MVMRKCAHCGERFGVNIYNSKQCFYQVCGVCGATPEGREADRAAYQAIIEKERADMARQTHFHYEVIAPGIVRPIWDGPDPLGICSSKGFYLSLCRQMSLEEWRSLCREIKGWVEERGGAIGVEEGGCLYYVL